MDLNRRHHGNRTPRSRSVNLSDGTVLVVAGTAGGAEIFDPDTYSFAPTLNAPTSHGQGASATELLDGRVLLVGGNFSPTVAELYDPLTGTFTPTGNTNAQHAYHSSTLLTDGTVLIAGGQQPIGPQTIADAEIYDPGTGQFTAVGSLNDDRSGHGAALMSDGRVLIAGGLQTTTPGQGVALNTAEIFDPGTGLFSTTGGTATSGYNDLLPIGNGLVLAAGAFSASAELYDPVAGTFSPTGSMQSIHSAGAVVEVLGGNVFVIGGASAGGPVITNAVESYSPGQGAFSPVAGLAIGRQSQAAVVLPDGRVLVVGGTITGLTDTPTAEIYEEFSILPGPPRN